MTVDGARGWIIKASLVICTVHIVFFVIAPTFGYPLTFQESLRLIEIVIPVFLGYLGSATHFLFQPAANIPKRVDQRLLNLLVRGPFFVFGVTSAAVLVAFGVSNRPPTQLGGGMELNTLAGVLATILGLLAVTTNVAVQYLFATSNDAPVHGGPGPALNLTPPVRQPNDPSG